MACEMNLSLTNRWFRKTYWNLLLVREMLGRPRRARIASGAAFDQAVTDAGGSGTSGRVSTCTVLL